MGCIQQQKSCLELTLVKLRLPNSLLLSHAFTCRVLVCFASYVFIFFVVGKELMQSVRAALQSFPKYSVNSKVSD